MGADNIPMALAHDEIVNLANAKLDNRLRAAALFDEIPVIKYIQKFKFSSDK